MTPFFASSAIACLLSFSMPIIADPGGKQLVDSSGALRAVQRYVLISNPGTYRVPDEQLNLHR